MGTTEFSNSPVTITSSDPGVLTAALDKISELSTASVAGLQDFATRAQTSRQEELSTLLDAVVGGKETADPDAQARKMILYIGGAVLAVIAFIAYFLLKRK